MAISKNYDLIEADLAGTEGVLNVTLYDNDNLFMFLDYMLQHLYDPKHRTARQMGAWIALTLRHRHEGIDNTVWNGRLTAAQLNQLKNAYITLQLRWPYEGMPEYVRAIVQSNSDEKTAAHLRYELSRTFKQNPPAVVAINCADTADYIIDANCQIQGSNQDLTTAFIYGCVLLCQTIADKLTKLGLPVTVDKLQLESAASRKFPAQINMHALQGQEIIFDINSALADLTPTEANSVASNGLAALANLKLSSLASLRIDDRWYSPESFKQIFKIICDVL